MANWRNTTLGSELTFQRGFDITKKAQSDGEYWVISSSGPSSKHFEAKVKGSGVLIGRKGTLGTVFFSLNDYWPHDTTLWVKDFHGNDERFAYYFLQTLRLEQYDVGASNPTLNRNHIHLLPVLYPQPSIQRRIAAVLSAYDDLIENNQRRIAILEELARSLYREWFVEFRFPGYEGVAIVERDGRRVPEGWGVVRATDALYINPPTKVPRAGLKPFLSMGGLSEISMLVNEEVEYREGNSGSKFKNGDTLFARITPCLENGKTGFVQFLTSDTDVAFGSTEFIVLRSRTLCPEMVYLLARSDVFRDNAIKSMSGATGRQRVQEKCFAQFYLAQPDTETLALFSSEASLLFKAIKTLAEKNANLRRTRDLLLPRLVSGELDVSELEIAGVPEEAA